MQICYVTSADVTAFDLYIAACGEQHDAEAQEKKDRSKALKIMLQPPAMSTTIISLPGSGLPSLAEHECYYDRIKWYDVEDELSLGRHLVDVGLVLGFAFVRIGEDTADSIVHHCEASEAEISDYFGSRGVVISDGDANKLSGMLIDMIYSYDISRNLSSEPMTENGTDYGQLLLLKKKKTSAKLRAIVNKHGQHIAVTSKEGRERWFADRDLTQVQLLDKSFIGVMGRVTDDVYDRTCPDSLLVTSYGVFNLSSKGWALLRDILIRAYPEVDNAMVEGL